jgi:hypothetical protein
MLQVESTNFVRLDILRLIAAKYFRLSAGLTGFLIVVVLVAAAFGQSERQKEAIAAPVPFSALHLYYISTTGDDRNSGRTPATAWRTPRHAVSCGDVILVEPGTYDGTWSVFGADSWGQVSDCPSRSGGIDGKGGIYFAVLLCAGPSLASCTVTSGNGPDFRVDQSNWAVEGFSMTQSGGGDVGANGCAAATSESVTTRHHIAFINDVAANCNFSGFGSYSWTSLGGVDQFAVVGAITYNDAASLNAGGLCTSGISVIPVGGPDQSAGTHVFIAGNFGYRNINAPSGAGCNTDGEGLVFDSWACTKYAYQAVAEQNVWWGNGSAGFEIFPNCPNNGDTARIYAFENTSYGNQRDPKRKGSAADLMLNQLAPTPEGGGRYDVFENIFVTTEATSGDNSSTSVYAAGIAINNSNVSLIDVSRNYIWQSAPGSVTTEGAPNTDVWVAGEHITASFPFGSNVYSDPFFANAGNLVKESPDCANYTNTTSCMNEKYHVARDLTPIAAVGYGYAAPGPCESDPYFPIWLKGVVFLRWTGSRLTENSGLITKPCDL